MEAPITPLDPVASTSRPDRSTPSSSGSADVTVREVPVGGKQADCVRALTRPPDGGGLTLARPARADIQGLRVKSTAHGGLAAANPLRYFFCGESLVYVQSYEFLCIYRTFHQDNVALFPVLVNV